MQPSIVVGFAQAITVVLIALGLTWKTDEPVSRQDKWSLDRDAMQRRRVA